MKQTLLAILYTVIAVIGISAMSYGFMQGLQNRPYCSWPEHSSVCQSMARH